MTNGCRDPILGTWSINKDTISLKATDHLYDTEYHVIYYNGEVCLLPGMDYKLISEKPKEPVNYSMALFQNKEFSESSPDEGRKAYKIKKK